MKLVKVNFTTGGEVNVFENPDFVFSGLSIDPDFIIREMG